MVITCWMRLHTSASVMYGKLNHEQQEAPSMMPADALTMAWKLLLEDCQDSRQIKTFFGSHLLDRTRQSWQEPRDWIKLGNSATWGHYPGPPIGRVTQQTLLEEVPWRQCKHIHKLQLWPPARARMVWMLGQWCHQNGYHALRELCRLKIQPSWSLTSSLSLHCQKLKVAQMNLLSQIPNHPQVFVSKIEGEIPTACCYALLQEFLEGELTCPLPNLQP